MKVYIPLTFTVISSVMLGCKFDVSSVPEE